MSYSKIKQEILADLENKDTMHYSEAGYDNWYSFFSDAEYGRDDIELYEEVMRNEFSQGTMELIWKNAHTKVYSYDFTQYGEFKFQSTPEQEKNISEQLDEAMEKDNFNFSDILEIVKKNGAERVL